MKRGVVVVEPLRALAHRAELAHAGDVGDERVHGLGRRGDVDGVGVAVLGQVHEAGAYGVVVAFTGWPVEAIEFFEGLEDDNSRAYWQAHKSVYVECVKGPMEALLAELEDDFGPGRVFRPNRDVRFSTDKSPYKLNCAAQLTGGYVSISADELFAGSGLYMPMPEQLKRLRAAIDADRTGARARSHRRRAAQGEVRRRRARDAEDRAARLPKDHPRIELLQLKGIVMSKAWPVGGWLGTKKAKDRVVATLDAARPLNAWIAEHVGVAAT